MVIILLVALFYISLLQNAKPLTEKNYAALSYCNENYLPFDEYDEAKRDVICACAQLYSEIVTETYISQAVAATVVT
ncbi:hypothetical protein GJ496_009123 [Pomphorhynchus laevis]|nr:hypothetical protein GJ496_009123 [Pomphorhynchus laevis]